MDEGNDRRLPTTGGSGKCHRRPCGKCDVEVGKDDVLWSGWICKCDVFEYNVTFEVRNSLGTGDDSAVSIDGVKDTSGGNTGFTDLVDGCNKHAQSSLCHENRQKSRRHTAEVEPSDLDQIRGKPHRCPIVDEEHEVVKTRAHLHRKLLLDLTGLDRSDCGAEFTQLAFFSAKRLYRFDIVKCFGRDLPCFGVPFLIQ